MSTQDLINYYANLLILQYRQKTNAYATIQALVTPVIMDQLPLAVQNAFSIDAAIGVQLDVLGDYVGVTRSGNGINGPITLTDDDFRLLIKLAILKNVASSSLATIQTLLITFFATKLFVFDYKNMHMGYLIDANSISQNLVQLFVTEGLLPKPMGVQLAETIYTTTPTTFFGFCSYPQPQPFRNSPFNTYSSYQLTYPWLSYSYGITA